MKKSNQPQNEDAPLIVDETNGDSTAIEQKQDAAGDGPATLPEPEPELVKAVVIANCKHNRDRFTVGQRIEVSAEDYKVLLEAKVIRPVGE
ncbi:hypothetical protein EBB07_33840 [Paenibacillaceae bacterium]|nr:hypothetical protein EBB07_33840 [Paenibacillaceae bacterium]